MAYLKFIFNAIKFYKIQILSILNYDFRVFVRTLETLEICRYASKLIIYTHYRQLLMISDFKRNRVGESFKKL